MIKEALVIITRPPLTAIGIWFPDRLLSEITCLNLEKRALSIKNHRRQIDSVRFSYNS